MEQVDGPNCPRADADDAVPVESPHAASVNKMNTSTTSGLSGPDDGSGAPSGLSGSKRKRPRDADDANPDPDPDQDLDPDDETRAWTNAEVRVQLKRARLEASISNNDQVSQLRFRILQLEQQLEEAARDKQQGEERLQLLQRSMDAIVQEHKRTLIGVQSSLQIETLVASLDVEKATRASLQSELEAKTAELLRTQARLDAVEAQIDNYQKTETVLAQSVSHFQQQLDAREQQRVHSVEHLKQELDREHAKTTTRLEQQLEASRDVSDKLLGEIEQLRAAHQALQATTQAMQDSQQRSDVATRAFQDRVADLETQNAVLQSKVDQVQKADAQLRKTLQQRDDEYASATQDVEMLRRENHELSQIASDLMDMAERAQAERQQQQQPVNPEQEQALARTRARLRESLGGTE